MTTGEYVVPGVGTVRVEIDEHRFALSNETWRTLRDVRWQDGRAVPCHVHERTAQHLEHLGLI